MRRLFTIAAVAMIGLLWVPTGAAAEENGLTSDPGKEAEFVGHINGLRAEQGLPALEVHDNLVAKARDWSRTMAQEGEIWHSNLPDGITANWYRLGENVGMGGSVESLHQAFVDSPSHYENLIDPGFRHVGIGVTVDADGTIFVSEVFMELASQPAPAASTPAAGTPSSSDTGVPPTAPDPMPVSDEERARSAPARSSTPSAEVPVEREPSERLVSVLDRLRALDG